MDNQGDIRTDRCVGALEGWIVAARARRRDLALVAARRAVAARVVGDTVPLAPEVVRDAVVAAVALDVGAALFDLSALDGAARTGELLDAIGHPGAAAAVRARFERPDGEGLPSNLAAPAIPDAASLLAVADLLVRDTDRREIDWRSRLEALKDGSGTALDLDIADAAIDLFLGEDVRRVVADATLARVFDALSTRDDRRAGSLASLSSLLRRPQSIDAVATAVVGWMAEHLSPTALSVHRINGSTCALFAGHDTLAPALTDDAVPGPARRSRTPCAPATVIVDAGGSVLIAPIGLTDPWGVVAIRWDEAPTAGEVAIVEEAAQLLHDHVARQEHERRLEALAHSDQLTGLANRWRFEEALDELFAAGDDATADAALIMCDVDGLKTVNDTLGHAAGDDVLRAVASAIARAVDPLDGLAARLGGDEFCILLRSGALLHAAEVARAVANDVRVSAPAGVDLSCGIAYAATVDSATLLLSAADQAQYSVKRRRPGRAVPAAPPTERRSRRRH